MLKLLVETGRIMSASNVVDSRLLNAVGVQVIRTLLSLTIYNMRSITCADFLFQVSCASRRES